MERWDEKYLQPQGEKPGQMDAVFCYHARGICIPKAPKAYVMFIARKV